jgi:hypothetical protein
MPSNNTPEMGKEEQPWWWKYLKSFGEAGGVALEGIWDDEVPALIAEASALSRSETIKEIRGEVESYNEDNNIGLGGQYTSGAMDTIHGILSLPSLTIEEQL